MSASEYRKKYRPIGAKTIGSHYAQLLAYRRSRRYNESSHHSWAWNGIDDSESTSSDGEDEIKDESRPSKTKVDLMENGVDRNGVEKEVSDNSELEERLKRLAVEKALKAVDSSKVDVPERFRKPRNPKNRSPIPKPTRSKSPVRKSADDAVLETMKSRPLFIPYGIGNKSGATTFNVRSDRDVRPSALRAKRRRQIEIERRAAEKLVAPARQKRKDTSSSAQFDEKMRRETTKWESEYANQYPSYEIAHYRRSLANMTPRPTSAF